MCRSVPRRRGDLRLGHGRDADVGGATRPGDVRARPARERRRGLLRVRRSADRRHREARRGVHPVPSCLRHAVGRPPPRDDGRVADGSLREHEHLQHRGLAPAEVAAARRARWPRQHDQPRHQLLDPAALPARVHGNGRHGVGARLRPRGDALHLGARAPPSASRGHQPRRARLRDARPLDAPRQRASRRDRRRRHREHGLRAHHRRRSPSRAHRRRRKRRPSSGSIRTDCAIARCPRREHPVPPAHAAVRSRRHRRPDRADRHGLGRRRQPGIGDGERRRPRHPRQRHDGSVPAERRHRTGSSGTPLDRSGSTCAPTQATSTPAST